MITEVGVGVEEVEVGDITLDHVSRTEATIISTGKPTLPLRSIVRVTSIPFSVPLAIMDTHHLTITLLPHLVPMGVITLLLHAPTRSTTTIGPTPHRTCLREEGATPTTPPDSPTMVSLAREEAEEDTTTATNHGGKWNNLISDRNTQLTNHFKFA